MYWLFKVLFKQENRHRKIDLDTVVLDMLYIQLKL